MLFTTQKYVTPSFHMFNSRRGIKVWCTELEEYRCGIVTIVSGIDGREYKVGNSDELS